MLWDIFLYHIIVMGLLAGPRMQVAFVAYVLFFFFDSYEQWRKPGWLDYIGGDATQLKRDYNNSS